MSMNRRAFLGALPLTLAAKPFAHPIGLNLYKVRASLAKAPAETYRQLSAAGIETLEVRPLNLAQHAGMISDAGLKPVHIFIESATITGAWDEWRGFMSAMAERYKMPAPAADTPRPRLEEMIEMANRHGVKRIGTSMLLPGERATAIDAINKAAGQCASAGLELYYHNHVFEFSGRRGARYFDRLRRELDPRVRLELDTFWAALSGDDPAAILHEWKGRVRSVHLKDMAADAPRGAAEVDVPPGAFRELGKGTLDFQKILNAAAKSGVEHYFIELDFPPGDPIESVRRCAAYLKGLSL